MLDLAVILGLDRVARTLAEHARWPALVAAASFARAPGRGAERTALAAALGARAEAHWAEHASAADGSLHNERQLHHERQRSWETISLAKVNASGRVLTTVNA